MARPRPTISSTVISGQEPGLSISQQEWRRIENVYAPLSADMREKIHQATFAFVCFEPFERDAVSATEALERIEAIDAAARDLFLVLSSGNADASVHADGVIARQLKPVKQSLQDVCKAMLSLSVACRDAKREIASQSAYRDGACWDQWIRALTKILRSKGLPTGAAKGSDKGEKTSQFVRLVQELQKLVPAAARRHHLGADTSLAKAIHEARRRDV